MKKNIICAAAAAAVIIISLAFIAFRYLNSDGAVYAYVYSDGELIRTIDLSDVDEPYNFRVEYGGGYNIVEVRHGEIGVVEASCPDEVCMHTGFIRSSVLPVVCLPNKLVIEIGSESNDGSGSLDAVTQ